MSFWVLKFITVYLKREKDLKKVLDLTHPKLYSSPSSWQDVVVTTALFTTVTYLFLENLTGIQDGICRVRLSSHYRPPCHVTMPSLSHREILSNEILTSKFSYKNITNNRFFCLQSIHTYVYIYPYNSKIV